MPENFPNPSARFSPNMRNMMNREAWRARIMPRPYKGGVTTKEAVAQVLAAVEDNKEP